MEPESKTIRILLIEDDEDDYLILRDCLMENDNHAKYKLDWVRTYRSGLKQIQRARHDIYLIDYYLVGNLGLDLLKEAIQAGCQAPILIITGQSDREIDQAALMAGAMDYLVKGKTDGQLLERSIRYALERNRLLKQIRELAVRDALTGLYNRRELHRFLDYELIKSRRYKHPFSLLLMDIDNFKQINDRYGHRIGDEILQRVAQVLISGVRGCDLPARYGGDEFIIVLPETPADQAWYGAERLRKAVEALSIQVTDENGYSEKIEITISTGVTEFPGDANSEEMLIEGADQALYQAKHRGCNQVIRFQVEQEKEQRP
jgi:two-component system cell cycle response regulator